MPDPDARPGAPRRRRAIAGVVAWLVIVAGIVVWAATRQALPAVFLLVAGAAVHAALWLRASSRRVDHALAQARPGSGPSHAERNPDRLGITEEWRAETGA